ncbi:hypothetical protein Pelo_7183 [Pelomyxa schiedti]|nr:hypothetical protein Pelo_7183 [Pelomyxa schiedti]
MSCRTVCRSFRDAITEVCSIPCTLTSHVIPTPFFLSEESRFSLEHKTLVTPSMDFMLSLSWNRPVLGVYLTVIKKKLHVSPRNISVTLLDSSGAQVDTHCSELSKRSLIQMSAYGAKGQGVLFGSVDQPPEGLTVCVTIT